MVISTLPYCYGHTNVCYFVHLPTIGGTRAIVVPLAAYILH